MTQQALADAVGVKYATQVSAWERDENAPNGANLTAIARALDVDVQWLQTGEGSAPSAQLTKNHVPRGTAHAPSQEEIAYHLAEIERQSARFRQLEAEGASEAQLRRQQGLVRAALAAAFEISVIEPEGREAVVESLLTAIAPLPEKKVDKTVRSAKRR